MRAPVGVGGGGVRRAESALLRKEKKGYTQWATGTVTASKQKLSKKIKIKSRLCLIDVSQDGQSDWSVKVLCARHSTGRSREWREKAPECWDSFSY